MKKERSGDRVMLAALFAAGFLGAFNANVVSVALPGIMNQFGISASTAQWLVSGYMMIQAVTITLYPFLSKRFTTRQIFLAAAVLFACGHIGCLLAPSFPVLFVFRALQALGGGVFIPTTMGSVVELAPEGKMGSYLSGATACITVGPALAPIVSGIMVTTFGWRGAFIVPLVVVAILAIMGAASLRPLFETQDVKIDVLSVVLITLTLVPFVFGMGQLTSNTPLGVGCLVVAVVFGYLFGRRQDSLEEPYLDIAPLRIGTFTVCCLTLIVAIMQNFSMSLLLPLHFQTAFGYTAFAAGLMIIPPILVMTVSTLVSGRLMDRFGTWPLFPIAFAIMAVGQLLVSTAASSGSLAAIIAASALVYGGAGLVQTPIQTYALSSLDSSVRTSGVSLVNVTIQTASAIGPALFVGTLSSVAAGVTAAGGDAVAAQTAGFSAAILLAAAIAALGFVVSIPLSRGKGMKSAKSASTSNE